MLNSKIDVSEYSITDDDLCARWNISKAVLQLNRHRGKSPPHLKLFWKVRYRLQDIEEFEQRCLKNTSA